MAPRKVNLLPLLVALAIGLGVCASGFLCGCTVSPKVVGSSAPSFDGNSRNGGVIDLGPGNKGPARVTAGWIVAYDSLVAKYGKDMSPPVRSREGIADLGDGTYSVDFEHLADKNTMAILEKSGIPP